MENNDHVELILPMKIHRAKANESVDADKGRVALQRGPVVYCVEWVDNHSTVRNILLPDDAILSAEFKPGLLNCIKVIKGSFWNINYTSSIFLKKQNKIF